jgi:hypothetical protein
MKSHRRVREVKEKEGEDEGEQRARGGAGAARGRVRLARQQSTKKQASKLAVPLNLNSLPACCLVSDVTDA